jgi:TetR/AcrR family transcriptional repressor of nem operon
MGRPRGFDEEEVVRAAVPLFAAAAYDGISVDDLVARLGVHRNSLYKTFGSKRGLYLAALRRHLADDVAPFIGRLAAAGDPVAVMRQLLEGGAAGVPLDLLLLAAVERAPVDAEVAAIVGRAFTDLDAALAATNEPLLTATLLGLWLRARAGAPNPRKAP